jgi:tRNA nucleotidyltransferase/poly(A) polymerase
MESFQQKIIQKVTELSPFYLVGGVVRDTLLNSPTKDMDGVIALPFEELEKYLKDWGYQPLHIGAKHPTISIFENGERIDFKPFNGNLEEDAQRRDFTINAIYQDFRTGKYIDPLGGLRDLENKVIRACGNAEERIKEDPIRILRLVRFSVKYGLKIEEETLRAAKSLVSELEGTATERISEELSRILTLDNPEEGIKMLDEIGYWQVFLPELSRLKGLVQNRYHSKDAWEHTLHVVRNTPPRLILRLAALFHDLGKWETASRECYAWGKCIAGNNEFKLGQFRLIGKPLQKWNGKMVEVHGARLDHHPEVIFVKHIKKSNSEITAFEWVKEGKRHFLGHEKESARLTKSILSRFRFSMVLGSYGDSGEKELLWLIENHMLGTLTFISEMRCEDKPGQLHERARRFAWERGWDGRNYRTEKLFNLLDLWRADFFGGKQREPQDREIFEKLQLEIRAEAKRLISRTQEINWKALEQFAKSHGIRGIEFGEFKENLRTILMLKEDSQELSEEFLEKALIKFRSKQNQRKS